jgi:hypothetical protein
LRLCERRVWWRSGMEFIQLVRVCWAVMLDVLLVVYHLLLLVILSHSGWMVIEADRPGDGAVVLPSSAVSRWILFSVHKGPGNWSKSYLLSQVKATHGGAIGRI